MATLEDIKLELSGRRFPSILEESDYEQICKATLREITRYSPLSKFVAFTTKVGVQDYYVFDPLDATTAGIAAGATEVRDVWWSPGGDWSSLNLFSPGWLMLTQMVIFTGNFFNQPSQMTVLRQKLDHWKDQFGSQGFDLIGSCGAATSFIRLYPIPQTETKVVLELKSGLTLADIDESMMDYFMQWLEYYAADSLANLYATTAGVDLLNFADSKEAMKYWQTKAERYYDRAISIQGGIGGEMMRS
jgi:hypothetical protein